MPVPEVNRFGFRESTSENEGVATVTSNERESSGRLRLLETLSLVSTSNRLANSSSFARNRRSVRPGLGSGQSSSTSRRISISIAERTTAQPVASVNREAVYRSRVAVNPSFVIIDTASSSFRSRKIHDCALIVERKNLTDRLTNLELEMRNVK